MADSNHLQKIYIVRIRLLAVTQVQEATVHNIFSISGC